MSVKSINQSVKRRNKRQKHTRKFRHLSQTQQKTTKVKARFTEKIIHTFSNYSLRRREASSLKQLRQTHSSQIEQKQSESFYYNIMQHTGHLRQNEQDQLKSKIRRTCENYYRIKIPYQYQEIIKKLSNKKDIILRQDKGRGVTVLNRTSYIE